MDPLTPLTSAIADAVVERLKPILEQARGRMAEEAGQALRPRLLTVAQAAVYLGRTEHAIRSLAATGALPAVRADSRVQFDLKDLDRWIEQNKV